MPRLAKRFGGRQVIGAGFIITTVGFVAVGLVETSWRYAAFVLPLVAIAVGMGLSNGPSSSAATACVPAEQVGEASGVSNMARYVGAAVATALAATIYGSVTANQTEDGGLHRRCARRRAGGRVVGDGRRSAPLGIAHGRRHPAPPGRERHRSTTPPPPPPPTSTRCRPRRPQSCRHRAEERTP